MEAMTDLGQDDLFSAAQMQPYIDSAIASVTESLQQ